MDSAYAFKNLVSGMSPRKVKACFLSGPHASQQGTVNILSVRLFQSISLRQSARPILHPPAQYSVESLRNGLNSVSV